MAASVLRDTAYGDYPDAMGFREVANLMLDTARIVSGYGERRAGLRPPLLDTQTTCSPRSCP